MGSNDRGESKNFKILKFKTSGKTGSGTLTTFQFIEKSHLENLEK